MSTYERALEALADPTRRRIYDLLCAGPKSVGQLAGELPVSRPAVSQHLRVLKEASLVEDDALGTRRVYHVRPDGLADLRSHLESMWMNALGGFKKWAEGSQRKGGRDGDG